jgi:hypothetical protein
VVGLLRDARVEVSAPAATTLTRLPRLIHDFAARFVTAVPPFLAA